MNLTKKIKQHLIQNNLIQSGDRILACVSGGPDSIALLHTLLALRKEFSFFLGIAHFNHALRQESSEEEIFVKKLAEKEGVDFFTEKKNISELAEKSKMSLEQTAREYRYRFFRKVLKEQGYHKFATAHTQDDLIETFLMRIFSGTGLSGLEGIPEQNESCIRPFLILSKKEILDFLKEHNYQYKIDHSNFNTAIPRNFIRHNIIPAVKENYKNINRNILNLVQIIKTENLYFNDMAEAFISDYVTEKNNIIEIDFKAFQKQHKALQRRILHSLLPEPTFYRIETVITASENASRTNEILLQEDNLFVVKEGNLIKIQRLREVISDFSYSVDALPCEIHLAEIGCRLSFSVTEPNIIKNIKQKDILYFDMDALNLPFLIRSRKPGDRIHNKKIKEILIDAKIPKWKREAVPLLVKDKKILSIFLNIAKKEKNNYINKDFYVHHKTKTVLKIHVRMSD